VTIQQRLDRWTSTGAITTAQYEAIAALTRKEHFSFVLELNALLYLGVIAFVTGVGWTIHEHFARLGDVAVLASLTLTFLAALYYCFARAHPYANGEVESSGFAFDYVLYLGCLVFGLELGYLEFRFHFLQDNWDHYLLLSSIVYFVLAYRFDNRFVLSLALSTLAGWFGLRLSHFPMLAQSLRVYALVYGAIVAAAGTALQRAGIKPHFLEAYLHVAANVLFVALLSGVFEPERPPAYTFGLLALSAVSIVQGLWLRRFAFVVYGVVYGYIGVTVLLLDRIHGESATFAYFAVSGTVVIASQALMARRFGREE
jgi:hypothetical protein